MKSIDILYYSLSLCAFLLVGSIWYVAYHVVNNLKSTHKVVEDLSEVTQEISTIKNIVKRSMQGMVEFAQAIIAPKSHEEKLITTKNHKRYSKLP